MNTKQQKYERLEELKEIFIKYLATEDRGFGIMQIDESHLRIEFEDFSKSDKLEIFDLLVKTYDKEKLFCHYSKYSFDIKFVGGAGIYFITTISIRADGFMIHSREGNLDINFTDLNVLREYHEEKTKREEEELENSK